MFTEFQDVDMTDEEHRAHPALGSTALKRFITDSSPSKSAAALGTAVHILAFQPELADTIAEKPAFKGDVDQWMRDAGPTASAAASAFARGHSDIVIAYPKGAREKQRAAFDEEHKGKVIVHAKDYEKAQEVAEALRVRDSGARIYLAPSDLEKAHKMAKALCRCEGLQALLSMSTAERETTVLAKHSLGIWTKARPDIRGQGRDPRSGIECRLTVDAKTTGAEDDDGFLRDMVKHGQDMQQAFFGDVEADRWRMPCIRYIYAVQKMPGLDGEHRVLELRIEDDPDKGHRYIEGGRKKYTAALVKAAIAQKTGTRPLLHWEGPHITPETPPWVIQGAKRIEAHARRLAEQAGIDYPEE